MLAPRTLPHHALYLSLSLAGNLLLTMPALAASTAPRAPDGVVSQPADSQLQFHVMAGELAAGRNQPEVAAKEFLKAVELAPNAELIARATTLALTANKPDLALTAAREWLLIEPTALEAREVITRLSMRAGLTEDAYTQCLAIVRDHPGGREDGFRHVALLLSQEPQTGPASLALMARLVAQNSKLAGAWQAQGLLALRFNDVETAEKSAREALRLQPASKDAPLLLAGALVKKGDYAGSEQIVDAQIKNSPDPSDLRLAYARLLAEAGQRDRAREQAQKATKADPGNDDAHFMLGLIALDDRRIEDAEAQFAQLAKGGERIDDAHYYLGRIAELRGQPAQALAQYDKVVSGNQALDAALRRAVMLARLGHLPDARTTLEQLRQQFPLLAPRYYLVEGELLVDAGELDQALDLYGMALRAVPEDNAGDLLYARSLVYERLGRTAQAEADLRAVLAKTPNDPRALNALGFLLIVHANRLEEAEKLVARALELTPDEPAVIDSMGWLRFRQGRHNEAVTLLGRAYEQFPDPEVAAHLGEALWTIGQRDRAQAVWTRALQDAPDSTVLRDTMKRLVP